MKASKEEEETETEAHGEKSSSREKKAIKDIGSYSYQNVRFFHHRPTSYSHIKRGVSSYYKPFSSISLKEVEQYNIDAAGYI